MGAVFPGFPPTYVCVNLHESWTILNVFTFLKKYKQKTEINTLSLSENLYSFEIKHQNFDRAFQKKDKYYIFLSLKETVFSEL
jgi:hypothetical protein